MKLQSTSLNWIFFFLLAFSFSACEDEDCVDLSMLDPSLPCPEYYAPVCGCNDVTYANQCYAEQAGVLSWADGPCETETNDCIDPSLIDPDAACTFIYDPVCGCNGITYSNSCFAEVTGGVTSWITGECPSSCIDPDAASPDISCPDIYLPVCGCDGNTYSNDCIAEATGLISWTPGPCSGGSDECFDPSLVSDEGCDDIYNPVCGCDGNTYENPCTAQNNGMATWTEGPCSTTDCIDPSLIDPSIGCIDLWDPVCGCDGQTYGNGCQAEIYAGITSWTPGECPPIIDDCIDPSLINPGGICAFVYDPVCGCNGETYSNSCFAEYTGGVTSWTSGECPTITTTDCIDPSLINPGLDCGAINLPVCGCDGVTYMNACIAQVNYGVSEVTEGACPTGAR